MSFCTTTVCPHGKQSFIWLADGPWLGDPADPDYARYPWVHAAPAGPSRLETCRLMPFATAEEAGEVCACGDETRRHEIPQGPIPPGPPRPWPCLDCECGNFRHRPEDTGSRSGTSRNVGPEGPCKNCGAEIPDAEQRGTQPGVCLRCKARTVPAHCPYKAGDRVIMRGNPRARGCRPGDPFVTGFRGVVEGGIGWNLLTGITDDGKPWHQSWGALEREPANEQLDLFGDAA